MILDLRDDKSVSFAGTPYWMAPEVISGNQKITYSSDIWSLACTIIELLTGKPPYFDSSTPWHAMNMIVKEEMPYPPNISDDLNDFLNICLKKNPDERKSAKELLEHPWMKKADKISPPLLK